MTTAQPGPAPSDEPKDFFGNTFKVGDIVMKAYSRGNEVCMERREVVRVKDGKLYLDGAKLVPVVYPGKCVNMTAAWAAGLGR